MRLLLAAALAFLPQVAPAQQSIGTLPAQEATVAGDLSLANGQALLIGSSTVLAKDHTAQVTLTRGGTVSVCATSSLHLSQSQTTGTRPLMLALDRGAVEVHTEALASDVLLTPDLRFTLQAAGPLDLRIRVTPNGDTCVEHRGPTAPTLSIGDPFSDATYELRAGQHVLFEHGSLKEVVDHESSPCGCPPAEAQSGVSVAEALLTPGTPTPAAEQHPFPSAVSQGLAPPPPTPQAAPGVVHAQVSTTLGYTAEAPATPPNATSAPTPPASQPPAKPSFAHRVGHFFKHILGG